MSSLGDKLIRDSYFGLIKTADEGAINDTLKQLQDGAGNPIPVSVSADGMSYTGIQDFSGANVIGIGGTGGTTYDLSSDQNGSNVDIKLTGSDASVDIVKLRAGSGITIDGESQNEILISATGGGGGGAVISNTTKARYEGPTTGSDVIYKSVLIPANTFTAGDILYFSSLLNMDLSAAPGSVYWSAWIAPNIEWLSGFTIGGGFINNSIPNMATIQKHMYIYTANGSGAGTSFFSDVVPVEQSLDNGCASYNDSNIRAIDWTVNQYLNFTAFIDFAGNFIEFNGCYIKKIN